MAYPSVPSSLYLVRRRELTLYPESQVSSAPTFANFVNANMKAQTFSNATVDRLYWYADMQHDYVDGTYVDFHIHWAPDGAAGGNVKWQLYYQWTERGGVWGAPTLLTVLSDAGTTQWGDRFARFIIPNTGQTWNSRLKFHLFRDPNDAQDTATANAAITAVGSHYHSRLSEIGLMTDA